jgi:hypothetical protein
MTDAVRSVEVILEANDMVTSQGNLTQAPEHDLVRAVHGDFV